MPIAAPPNSQNQPEKGGRPWSLLAGFSFKKKVAQDNKPFIPSVVPATNDDGAIPIDASGINAWSLDFDGIYKNEFDLVRKYRDVAQQPEARAAIDDIINDAIIIDENEPPVKLNQDNLEVSDNLKEKIDKEFQYILQLLEFNKQGQDIFKRWYTDGRLFYHILIDADNYLKEGIHQLRYMSPLDTKKVREENRIRNEAGAEIVESYNDFYIYSPRRAITVNGTDYSHIGYANFGVGYTVRLTSDSVVHVHSGQYDEDKNYILSYLHQAIRPINQLRMQEDAVVIYRLSRAPQRRIFYIDVGNMPAKKAEQYIKTIMTRYKNKMTFDVVTGEVKDYANVMTMMEDYWLPRVNGQKGTEVDTLQGAANFGDFADLSYWKDLVYLALNVPLGRLQQEKTPFNFGLPSQITRDELKFAKFVAKLRNRFADLFYQLLRTQLILKGVITEADWASIRHKIFFDFLKDNDFAELKDIEILQNKLAVLKEIEPYVGVYFSNEYVKRKILCQDDDEIKEIAKQIEQDKKDAETGEQTSPLLSPLSPFGPMDMPAASRASMSGTEMDDVAANAALDAQGLTTQKKPKSSESETHEIAKPKVKSVSLKSDDQNEEDDEDKDKSKKQKSESFVRRFSAVLLEAAFKDKEPAMLIDGWRVYLVDGEQIRKNQDIEFSDWASSATERYIPSDEIWIDRGILNEPEAQDDIQFFVKMAIKEAKKIKSGDSQHQAYQAVEKMPEKNTRSDPRLKLLNSNGGIDVWLVDGNIVRQHIGDKFTEGGNWCVYPEEIQKGEIWIEQGINPDERGFVELHERKEVNEMLFHGLSYNPAHKIASKVELAARNDPKSLPGALEEEVQAYLDGKDKN